MPSSLDAAFAYCRWLTGRSGSHFAFSFLLLPPRRRRAMEAVYAFCRAMDDVVDRPDAAPAEARRELERWRRELEACERGFPAHPIAAALKEVRREFPIPMEYFRKLIAGMEMDLDRRRYATFEELKVYCEHVASVVGLISVRVFGCRSPEADRYATALGIALQLTNILRDLKVDARQGRVYLPAEDLRCFGMAEGEFMDLAARAEPMEARRRLKDLMAFQAERARGHFCAAAGALRASGEAGKLLPARLMGGVYARLLERLRLSGWDVFSGRPRVPGREQLWIAARCLITSS